MSRIALGRLLGFLDGPVWNGYRAILAYWWCSIHQCNGVLVAPANNLKAGFGRSSQGNILQIIGPTIGKYHGQQADAEEANQDIGNMITFHGKKFKSIINNQDFVSTGYYSFPTSGMGSSSCLPAWNPLKASTEGAQPSRTRSNQRCPSVASSIMRS